MKRYLSAAILLTFFSSVFYFGCSDASSGLSGTTERTTEGTTQNKGKGNHLQSIQCETFDNIEHCTIGNTSLSLLNSSSILAVYGFSSSDSDGVTSTFDNATEWSQTTRYYAKSLGGNAIKFYSKNSGGVTSSLFCTQVNNSDTTTVTPNFTSSPGNSGTYLIQVYDDTSLVGSQSGVSNQTLFTIVPDDPLINFKGRNELSGLKKDGVKINYQLIWNEQEPPVPPTAKVTSNGEWQWSLGTSSSFKIILPNSSEVSGNKFVVTQILNSGGPYPYPSFTEVVVKSNVDSLHILDESFTAAP